MKKKTEDLFDRVLPPDSRDLLIPSPWVRMMHEVRKLPKGKTIRVVLDDKLDTDDDDE